MKIRGNLDVKGSIAIKIGHFVEQQASGVDSTDNTLTADAWNSRTLNTTISNTIVGASRVFTSQLILPAGRYYVDGWTSHYGQTSFAKARIVDVTLGVGPNNPVLLTGPPMYGVANVTILLPVSGIIVFGAEGAIELQHFPDNVAADSAGNAAGITGINEIYTELMVWKL